MAIQKERRMTVAEYLEWEERQELRHEYIDGEIIEMSGGTGNHSKIMMNIALALGGLVNMLDFVFHSSNMRIRIDANRYVYPDLSLVRMPEVYEDHRELALLNPVFVVEVTSPSSLMRDRVEKPDLYFAASSIDAYLVVDHERPRADLYTRAQEGWHVRVFNQAEAVIPLPQIGCELPLAQVYRGIKFEAA